jgi:hypothetical protein
LTDPGEGPRVLGVPLKVAPMKKLTLLFALALYAPAAHAAGVVVFNNPPRTDFPSSVPYTAGEANVSFDDAHTTATGVLTGFDVWLWNRSGVDSDATISIYTGDPDDGVPGALLAGAYTVFVTSVPFPHPGGLFHVDTPDNPALPTRDLWFAVGVPVGSFGPVWNGHFPLVGMSHNIIRDYDSLYGEYVDTGQADPSGPANQEFTLYVDPAVPATPPTWGRIKALYH